jgi:hypothetical protein
MIEANIKIIEELKFFLMEVKNNNDYRKILLDGENAFTRDRCLPLENIVCLIINMLKKSLSIEIQNFFEAINEADSTCTKSAFSQQRVKLKHEFFVLWNVILVDSFYLYYKDYLKRWNGFRLIAFDGSTEYLINEEKVIEYFGVQENQSTSIAMGRIMTAYDVLNGITVSSVLLPISNSEQAIVNSWIDLIEEDMLSIYDRGFPSFVTIYLLNNQERERRFLMRTRTNFNKEVIEFSKNRSKSRIVEFKANADAVKQLEKYGYKITLETTVKVRLVKVILDDGTIEILITNLYDSKEYPVKIFKELYFKRWGIETNYDELKNKLQLESFSGHRPETILQDFYANIFIGNLQSIISKQCEKELFEKTNHRKHDYKINKNVSIGMMKNKIIFLFLDESPRNILCDLQRLFLKNIEPIRPGRKYERKPKIKRLKGKYQTLSNYRRAI